MLVDCNTQQAISVRPYPAPAQCRRNAAGDGEHGRLREYKEVLGHADEGPGARGLDCSLFSSTSAVPDTKYTLDNH
jgi:hypothetical protein